MTIGRRPEDTPPPGVILGSNQVRTVTNGQNTSQAESGQAIGDQGRMHQVLVPGQIFMQHIPLQSAHPSIDQNTSNVNPTAPPHCHCRCRPPTGAQNWCTAKTLEPPKRANMEQVQLHGRPTLDQENIDRCVGGVRQFPVSEQPRVGQSEVPLQRTRCTAEPQRGGCCQAEKADCGKKC